MTNDAWMPLILPTIAGIALITAATISWVRAQPCIEADEDNYATDEEDTA